MDEHRNNVGDGAQVPTPGQPLSEAESELIARSLRTIHAYDAVRYLRDALTATTARISGYDWNADLDGITRQQGDAFAAADKVFADLNAAVDAHPDIELPECEACGGIGKIEEPARTTGANQHSACIRDCDECDGCGFAPDRPHAPVSRPGDGVEGGGERAVMVCPQCDGEGFYADGVDEAACSTECTRCGGNGWIVDLAALTPPAEPVSRPAGEGERSPLHIELSYLFRDARGGVKVNERDKELAAIAERAAKSLLRPAAPDAGGGWMPIETAPKDGTVIDVWREDGGRDTVFWGKPFHTCGEMGQYCDDDWHGIRAPGWVCNTFNEFVGRNHNPFTHWRPLPAPPALQPGGER